MASNTVRQRLVTKKLLENGGKKSVSKAMREAGYSRSYAKNPQKLKKTRTYQEMLDSILPEEEVLEANRYLLHSNVIDVQEFHTKVKDADIRTIIEGIPGCVLKHIVRTDYKTLAYYWIPNGNNIKYGVDMAHKLRVRYKETSININVRKDRFEGWTPDQLKEYADTGKIPDEFQSRFED